MKRLIIIVVVILVLFAGCQAITAGTVYDKKFTPAHDEIYMATRTETKWIISLSDGKMHPVIMTSEYPALRHVLDTYVVFIKAFDKDDKPQTARHEVTKQEYERLNIGDWYDSEAD